jgi:hypothetical protein
MGLSLIGAIVSSDAKKARPVVTADDDRPDGPSARLLATISAIISSALWTALAYRIARGARRPSFGSAA